MTTTAGRVEQRADLRIRLFVTGRAAPRSVRAVAAVEAALGDSHTEALEVIDVLEHPEAAEEARVVVTPLLLRLEPPPQLRVIGDLSAASRDELVQWIHEGMDLDGDR